MDSAEHSNMYIQFYYIDERYKPNNNFLDQVAGKNSLIIVDFEIDKDCIWIDVKNNFITRLLFQSNNKTDSYFNKIYKRTKFKMWLFKLLKKYGN